MVFHILSPSHPLGKKLGKGSYGQVYTTTIGTEHYAVKVVGTSDCIESVNELDIMRRLSHPHLVTCCGLREGPTLELVLPLASYSLYDFITQMNPSRELLLQLLYQVATGVEFLHRNDILHLDLNYANILVFREDRGWIAKISDFGLSTRARNSFTSYQRLVTSSYRAPESFTCRQGKYLYGKTNDIWSLGMTIIRCFSPRLKVYRGNVKTLIKKIQGGLAKMVIGDDKLVDLVNKMLQIDPSVRPTASQVVEEMRQIIGLSDPSPLGEVTYPLPVPRGKTLDDYRAIDRISYACYRQKQGTDVVFSASDLYHRTTGEWRLRALVCLGLTIRSWGRDIDYSAFKGYFGVTACQRDIDRFELEVIKQSQGIITGTALWERIPPGCEAHYYECLRNADYYSSLDLESLPRVDRTIVPSFYTIYPETEYWKYMSYSDDIDEAKLEALYRAEQ